MYEMGKMNKAEEEKELAVVICGLHVPVFILSMFSDNYIMTGLPLPCVCTLLITKCTCDHAVTNNVYLGLYDVWFFYLFLLSIHVLIIKSEL